MATKNNEIPAIAGLTFEQLQECLALGASLDHITQLSEGGFGFDQIKSLAKTLAKAQPSGGGGISAADLKELIHAQRKAMKPENEQHPGISVYSYPEGEQARPKPALRRETYFMGAREQVDRLSPLEVELYNRFDKPMQARNGRWQAKIRNVDGVETLWIEVADAKSMDGRMSLPSLSLILRELLDGEAAANPDKMAERLQDMEQKIAALLAERAQPTEAVA